MANITLSSKGQVTIPIDILRRLGLKAGDKLIAELIDNRIVLLPQPESWTDYFGGSLKGVYGSTVEEIDRYISEERATPERWEWHQQLDDLVATDETVWVVVESLRLSPNRTASLSELSKKPLVRDRMVDSRDLRNALDKVVEHGGVRKIALNGAVTEVYRLVRELADG
ncbi:MAG: AbrB/MazE/SpoVT family DNA-binding domain-containing protein [Chloroflexi bacterium]|nr:AbrB/MazE/SpoVT family DNA-binding domain-containing protein [Chloroflexota bacterium]